MTKTLISKRNTQDFEIHPYDVKIDAIYRLIEKELSKENIALIKNSGDKIDTIQHDGIFNFFILDRIT